MALGDNYSNNNQGKGNNYSPTVYSPYKMGNPESKVDATNFTMSFWNSMLKLSFAPLKPSNDDTIAYDYDNEIAIYLTHTKARILYDEICLFQQNPDEFNNRGVNSNSGVISICNGKEFGITTPCLVIRKVNGETGSLEASAAYEFKTGYHYAIRNFNEEKFEFDKAYYDDLEIEQFKTLLLTYYEAMTGSMAYTVIDNNKYEVNRMSGKINAIGEKLGVEFGRKGNYSNKSSNSIFNKSNSGRENNTVSSSIEDIENMM